MRAGVRAAATENGVLVCSLPRDGERGVLFLCAGGSAFGFDLLTASDVSGRAVRGSISCDLDLSLVYACLNRSERSMYVAVAGHAWVGDLITRD